MLAGSGTFGAPAEVDKNLPVASQKARVGRMTMVGQAKYGVGQIVRHRFFPFRGVIFDVDPSFANTEEWYQAIPEEIRPSKEQPFYHLLAENSESSYVAYVSQQNLVRDEEGEPIDHPAIGTLFEGFDGQRYKLTPEHRH